MKNPSTVIKRIFILLVTLGVLLAIAITGINYFRSFKDISFEVHNPNNNTYTLTIYPREEGATGIDNYKSKEAIHTLTSSATVSLRTGKYVAIVNGTDLLSTTTDLTVAKDTHVAISLVYTPEKLEGMLRKEQAAIRQALYIRYPTISPKRSVWSIIDEKLHNQGEWYSATFRVRDTPVADIYRVVLQKQDNTWQVAVVQPDLVLTTHVNPNVPREVLMDVNTRQKTQLREM